MIDTSIRLFTYALAALAVLAMATSAEAADSAFVGKLALIADAEVAKELGLSDETKQKLLDLIDKREQAAVGIAAKMRSLPPAKQAEQLAPFVAESEKLGMALLDDTQVAKLNKLRVAKDGMLGVLAPDIAGNLQVTPEQHKEISGFLQQHKSSTASANDFQKRMARQLYERRIAGVLNDTQRGTWEQLSGVPAGGSAVAQSAGGAAPSGASGVPAGSGGVTVQRASAGAAQLALSEDGQMTFKFEFTPWKAVLEFFAKQGGYSFATDLYPSGTFNYSDPKSYTPEQAIDILNLHLMTKGFILVKREKLLRLFDVANNGPVPPEFVPEIGSEELEERGDFELVSCLFQLNRWPPAEAEAEIKKRLGPYGSITVLSAARQLLITELGGKLRWIKRTIDAVEQPDAPKDDRFEIIKLNRITATEFLTNVRQLMGIPDNQTGLPDGTLRLSINELDGLVFSFGKGPKVDQVKDLAKQMDNYAPASRGPGGITIVEQPQFGVYAIMHADAVHVENVVRTLLAGTAPDLKVQLDQKSAKLSVWGRAPQHAAIQAIIAEMEQNGNMTEVIRLKKLDPQTAMTSINQLFGSDPTGRTGVTGLRVSADPLDYSLTLSGTPALVEAAKSWLAQRGELGTSASGRGLAGGMEERANRRVLPLSPRTMRNILSDAKEMWSSDRATLSIIEEAKAPGGRSAATKTSPAATKEAAPKGEAKPAQEPLKKGDFTSRAAPRSGYQFVSELSPVAEGTEAIAPQEPSSSTGQTSEQNVPSPATEDKSKGPEIRVQVTPGGIVISSDDLDALDEFQSLLQELVEADERRGKRTETFPLRYKDADVAYGLLKAMMDGGANVSSGLSGLTSNMLGGGVGNLMGALLGGGGAASTGGTVSGTASGTPATITPDAQLNVLYITALPRDLDNIEQLIELIDREESPDPPAAMKRRFIPVLHGKAADVAVIVREQFAGQIFGESNNQQRGGRGGDPAQALIMAALSGGGRGGRGGGGGALGGRGGQQNLGEKPKMMISVATDSNALIVSAPDHLFKQVEEFVEMLDLENTVPDAVVRVVNLRRTNTDVAFQSLGSMLGPNATITRILPTNPNALAGGRGGQQNNNQSGRTNNSNNNNQGGQQQGNQQSAQNLARLQQFNQGQTGRGGPQGGGNFGGRGGPPQGGGNFGGGNTGGRGGR